jgi:uncharacterized membrane protein
MRSPLMLSKSRIEGLSDGVFSITMTLLVMKLEIPEVMHHSSDREMLGQMLALWPAFATFVVTFLIAGVFWYLHHITFHSIRHVTGGLLWIDLLFLMFVALLPFSAGLMTHLLVHPISQVFYIGNQLAIAVLLNAHWLYAKRKDLLDPSDPGFIRSATRRIGFTAVFFAACLVVAFLLMA